MHRQLFIGRFIGLLIACCGFAAANAQIPLTSGIANIVVGGAQACLVTTAGGAKCWGNNNYGELGTGTCFSCANQEAAADVVGLTSGVSQVSAGLRHSCALTTSGGVKCWGLNTTGELGITGSTEEHSPVNVLLPGAVPLTGITAIATGYTHNCAITTGGGVKCWGSNGGALGTGDTITRYNPVDVPTLTSGVTAIAAGTGRTCALSSGGGVKCWGTHTGDGTPTTRLSPVDVSGLTSGVTAIAVGSAHSCALTTSGGVKCWGADKGVGSATASVVTPQTTPLDVAGLTTGVIAIAAGTAYTCAVTNAGQVKCFGRNSSGELGDGSMNDSLTPVIASGVTGAVKVVAGIFGSTCALTRAGGVKCWGLFAGDGTAMQRSIPVDTLRLSSRVTALAGGGYHHCALTLGGAMKCWGNNNNMQLGDWQTTSPFWPTAVPVTGDSGFANSGASAITTGEFHSCALNTAGGVKCWGRNVEGQIGTGSFSPVVSTPTFPYIKVSPTGLNSGVSAVASGYRHTCAVTSAGGAMCWGDNSAGQLGDSTKTNRPTPQFVPGLASGVTLIRPGQFHTCALVTGGGVKCWGSNTRGQLGDGTQAEHLTLNDVPSLSSGVTALALGLEFTCALTTGGGVKCWGRNADGQLGDGTLIDKLTPVDVFGLTSGVVDISAGTAQACALLATGGVKCWGFNIDGRLGDGTVTSRSVPTDVAGLTSGVAAIGIGYYNGCAALTAGGVKCWGNNAFGQVGDNSTTQRLAPVNTSFTFNVVGSAGAQGSISPNGTAVIAIGEQATFAITASAGFSPSIAGTCAGVLTGTAPSYVFTTRFLYGGCTVAVTFTAATVPAMPLIDTATPGNSEVTIAFGSPHDGGSPITLYTATCGGQSASGSSSPITVSGLVNGVPVACTMIATNANGNSVPSGPTNTVIPASVPGAPTIGVPVTGNTQASIYFSPPAVDGGLLVTRYSALCMPGSLTASAADSPITLVGIANGVAITCTVTAHNLVGASAPSAGATVTPSASVPFAILGVRSRKTHGSAGVFEIPIDTTQPINGAVTVEPRTMGAGHQIVFLFNGPISALGAVNVSQGARTAIFSGNEAVVTLTVIPDNQRVTVTLLNTTGPSGSGIAGSSVASLGFLIGDANGSRSVNALDVSGAKARSGQRVTAANFRFDANASGMINAADILPVKARVGLVLP